MLQDKNQYKQSLDDLLNNPNADAAWLMALRISAVERAAR